MTRGETVISLNMPTELVEKMDTIAKEKYLNRADVIIDACAYYCQHYDMYSEHLPETTRNIFFNLARHDNEFRKTLRDVLRDGIAPDTDNGK
jgi:metal-responsive CopG/Arc/MetJ family transcriptional regulator